MPGANGSAQLHEIAARMKAEGAGGLKLKMTRGLRAGAQPLIPAVRAAAIRQLPHSGGLNVQVAGQKITVSVSTAAKTAGVRLKTTAPDTLWTDSGYVRHPVFETGQWVTQQIPEAAGWWSKTLQIRSPLITPILVGVIADVTAELEA